jgi:hypothetical protein
VRKTWSGDEFQPANKGDEGAHRVGRHPGSHNRVPEYEGCDQAAHKGRDHARDHRCVRCTRY